MPPPPPPPGSSAAAQVSASDMGPPPSTPKRFSAGAHPHPHHQQDHSNSHPLPTPPTSHFEDYQSPRQTPTISGALAPESAASAVGSSGSIANDRTPTAASAAAGYRQRSSANSANLGQNAQAAQGHSSAPQAQAEGTGAYVYDDAYNRSRTPSPILPRLQPVPEAAALTGDGHLTFPPFGISQAHLDSIMHDPATDSQDPSLMQVPDIETLVLSLRQLTVDMANTEDIRMQQLINSAKTLGEQALGYAQQNTLLRSSLNNTRIHAISAINALSASASHTTVAERDLRQRLQVELDGSRAQSRMLAGMVGRANRKHEEENAGEGSGSEAAESMSNSDLIKERNKLLADKRWLRNRVRDAEGQVQRLEQELRSLRPLFVRTGSGSSHPYLPFPTSVRGHTQSHSHGYISDPFALGSTTPIIPGNAPNSPSKKERGLLASQSSQRRRRAATLGDAESEHLLLAARRYREVNRRAETAAAQEVPERIANAPHPSGHGSGGAYPHSAQDGTPNVTSPSFGARTAGASGPHNGPQHTQYGLPYGAHHAASDLREGGTNGQMSGQIVPSMGPGGGSDPFEPGHGSASSQYPSHLLGQRPVSSSTSMGHFGTPGPGFGSLGPTPRTPPPMHDRLPRVARTEGSIARIRSIPGSPRGSPSSAMRGTEWPRSGSVAGLGTVPPGVAAAQGAAGPGSGLFSDLLNAAQSVFRPGQEGRALVQSRIHDQRGRRPDIRGLGPPPAGSSTLSGRDAIAYEHDEDDNDSLPYSEDESEEDEGVGVRSPGQDGDVGDESFAKNILGSPKRRRVSAALNSPSKRMAKGRKQPSSVTVPGSPSKDRTPRPVKGKGSLGVKGASGGGDGAGLSALDLLADQAAASSTQSQHSGDSGSEQPSGPLALGGTGRAVFSGGEEEGMDVEQPSPKVGGGAGSGSGGSSAQASQEKRSTYTRWSGEEDTKLRAAIKQHGQRWELVSRAVETRSYHQCRQRYLLLRRKEAAKNDANGDANSTSARAASSNGVLTAPNSPTKSTAGRGVGSGSRSGRSNSEGEGEVEVDEIDSEDQLDSVGVGGEYTGLERRSSSQRAA
ncbi:hypothetical protein OC842_002717 [Tilletia horrida]|uniref:Myb-like domain-containing protein n=1 Tax=Tilletia horrida TaxID=155126 RepID=A0AAN6GCS9_9BASI|nr:hypothetical protein OC842_002717 [Tilletia horrida]